MSNPMNEAMLNMLAHRVSSTSVDRTGWTREQWVEDARRLMGELDGSVQSLVNGHVLALLDALEHAEARKEEYHEQWMLTEAEVKRIRRRIARMAREPARVRMPSELHALMEEENNG